MPVYYSRLSRIWTLILTLWRRMCYHYTNDLYFFLNSLCIYYIKNLLKMQCLTSDSNWDINKVWACLLYQLGQLSRLYSSTFRLLNAETFIYGYCVAAPHPSPCLFCFKIRSGIFQCLLWHLCFYHRWVHDQNIHFLRFPISISLINRRCSVLIVYTQNTKTTHNSIGYVTARLRGYIVSPVRRLLP